MAGRAPHARCRACGSCDCRIARRVPIRASGSSDADAATDAVCRCRRRCRCRCHCRWPASASTSSNDFSSRARHLHRFWAICGYARFRGAQATRADRAARAGTRGTPARARSREAREPVAGRRPGARDRGRVGGGDRGTRALDAVRPVRGRVSRRGSSVGGCRAACGRCTVREVRDPADRLVPARQPPAELSAPPARMEV